MQAKDISDDQWVAVTHLIAQTLAEDHAACDPGICEFVGEAALGISEFDHTASLLTGALQRAGWLRLTAEPFALPIRG